jgi:hypothetical protein
LKTPQPEDKAAVNQLAILLAARRFGEPCPKVWYRLTGRDLGPQLLGNRGRKSWVAIVPIQGKETLPQNCTQVQLTFQSSTIFRGKKHCPRTVHKYSSLSNPRQLN